MFYSLGLCLQGTPFAEKELLAHYSVVPQPVENVPQLCTRWIQQLNIGHTFNNYDVSQILLHAKKGRLVINIFCMDDTTNTCECFIWLNHI